jgi:hypothetical protein
MFHVVDAPMKMLGWMKFALARLSVEKSLAIGGLFH